MSRTILVREAFDWIEEGMDLSSDQFEELVRYLSYRYPEEKVMELQYKRLRFINIVGMIQCSSFRIEILPKISVSQEEERHALLSMLMYTRFLPITFFNQINIQEGKNDLLEAFLSAFVDRLGVELNKGLYKTYVQQQENLDVLKGKLLLPQHLRQNAVNPVKAFCQFDQHQENNWLNQLFKQALKIVDRSARTHTLKSKVKRYLYYLEEVSDAHFTPQDLKQIQLNRQNQRFEDAVLFSKMILQGAQVYGAQGKALAFSLLFPMNQLFEQYIGAVLMDILGRDQVIYHPKEKRLLRNLKSGRENILLEPDFLIQEHIILDTKWKSSVYNSRIHYEQSDIYQMYAYVMAYQEAKRCILLYPRQEENVELPKWQVIDSDKRIEMWTVRVDTVEGTREDLRGILGST